MRSRFSVFAAALTVIVLGFSAQAHAEQGQCGGADMLAELAQTKPTVFEKISAEAKALGNTEALLWRVEKKDVAPSFLFGTMHLSDKRVTTLRPAADDALKSAKTVILEVADLSPSALSAAMATEGADLVYLDGRTLSGQLSAEEFAKVEKAVAASGLPGNVANLIKPWLVSTLLSVSDCERRQLASGAKVLDMQIGERAKAAGIPVLGLETIQQQLSALSGVPEDQQLQMLRVSLKHFERTDDLMETVLQFYLKRNMGAAMPFEKALAAEMNIPDSAFEGFEKSLLVDRNARMSRTAAKFLDEGNAFIAVGALHLPGKTGLVSLLREAGFTVVPVE